MANAALESEIRDYWLRASIRSMTLDSDMDGLPQGNYIYHYTTPDGLLGIMQSQKLWASEASYLNDSAEIKYGVNLAHEELSKLLENSEDEREKDFIMRTAESIEVFGDQEIYVACFCENGDLLSQWKGYSDFGEGYSIGFDIRRFANSQINLLRSSVRLRRVIYEIEEQKRILADEMIVAISSLDDWLERYPNEESLVIPACAIGLTEYIKLQLCRFKAYAFHEEQEWRAIFVPSLITQGDPEYSKLVKFRVAKNKIIPYVELDLAPFTEVFVGPKLNHASSRKAIKLCYKTSSKPLPNITKSKIQLQ